MLPIELDVFGQDSGAPTITSQPLSQTADYGADISFFVAASGMGPFTYQWQKNGENLIDYDNVAGSQTDTLSLVGVAGNEVGFYKAIITAANGNSVTSSVAILTMTAQTIFSDTFENSSSNWTSLLTTNWLRSTNALVITSVRNHTSGGNYSLAMTNSLQKVYHNLPVQYDCRTRFSFWLFDNGSTSMSCGGELRGYSGPGYGRYINPGGLRQILGVGKSSSSFPTTNSGNLAGELVDTNKYQGRILRGTNAGWFNLNASRSVGWHYFRIDRSAAGVGNGRVDFYVDGNLARTITNVTMAFVDSIFLGAMEVSATNSNISIPGVAYFDDVTVDVFPGLFDWQNLASSTPILDWIQHRETGTNWNVINVTPSTMCAVNGAETNASLGDWAADGPAIYATGIRGHVDYAVTTLIGGVYRIELEGRERNNRTPIVGMPVDLSLDGETLGHLNLPYTEQGNGLLHAFTPFIQAGSHTLRIHWDNVDPRRSLLIQAVRLQDLLTADSSSALQVWAQNRLVAQNGVEVCPATSLVSPVCVEGRGQYLSMMN